MSIGTLTGLWYDLSGDRFATSRFGQAKTMPLLLKALLPAAHTRLPAPSLPVYQLLLFRMHRHPKPAINHQPHLELLLTFVDFGSTSNSLLPEGKTEFQIPGRYDSVR